MPQSSQKLGQKSGFLAIIVSRNNCRKRNARESASLLMPYLLCFMLFSVKKLRAPKRQILTKFLTALWQLGIQYFGKRGPVLKSG